MSLLDEAQRRLNTYPSDVAHLDCETCGRSGQYPKAVLIERYGAEAGLVNILNDLAKDCPQKIGKARDPAMYQCGVIWRELKAESDAERKSGRHPEG